MSDLIELFCLGTEGRFLGKPCLCYLPEPQECLLLKKYPFAEVFEKARCQPTRLLHNAVKRNLHRYRHVIVPNEHFAPMVVFLLEMLKTKRLTQRYTLRGLKSYINQTVYYETLKMIRQELNLPKKECRYCGHFSPSDNFCLEHNIPKSPTGHACRESLDLVEHVSLDDMMYYPASLIAETQSDAGILLMQLVCLLRKRIRQATTQHTKRMHKRQYVIFCRLLSIMSQGVTKGEAVQHIARVCGASVPTVNRDIQEIKLFFETKNICFGEELLSRYAV